MKLKKNFLDFVPKRNSLIEWSEDGGGIVTLEIKNRGFFNRIAQFFFKRPKISKIALEEFGSFIWKNLDGEKSIYQIGALVKERFGQKAEPLYERLCAYVRTLRRQDYIVYAKNDLRQEYCSARAAVRQVVKNIFF